MGQPIIRRHAFGALFTLILGLVVLVTSLTSFSPLLSADELSKGEKRQFIANENRMAAQSRAQQALGYDQVDRDARNRHVDYYALSAQIKVLSRIIDRLAAARVISEINPPPSVPLTNGMNRPVGTVDMSNAYGPEGPTERAVKLLAEYQLMRNGNNRLKVGEISDQEKFLTLNIVTIDGSLVEKYKIDKLSGAWSPVHEP